VSGVLEGLLLFELRKRRTEALPATVSCLANVGNQHMAGQRDTRGRQCIAAVEETTGELFYP